MTNYNDIIQIMERFNKKYIGLFDIKVNELIPYVIFKNVVINSFIDINNNEADNNMPTREKVGVKKYFNLYRQFYSFFGILKHRLGRKKYKYIIFTSSVHRRDKGLNLVAQYFIEKYGSVLVCETPSRNSKFNAEYKKEILKEKYLLLDFIFAVSFLYEFLMKKLFVKRYNQRINQYTEQTIRVFEEFDCDMTEKKIINKILEGFPKYCYNVQVTHNIAKRFLGTMKAENHIDFSGSLIEYLYGITNQDANYFNYQIGVGSMPTEADIWLFNELKKRNYFVSDFTEMVYSTKIKQLIEEKGMNEKSLKVVGNLRLKMYETNFLKKNYPIRDKVLVISQPYDQNPNKSVYYQEMVLFVKKLRELIKNSTLEIIIKLHPVEVGIVEEFYQEQLEGVQINTETDSLFQLANNALFAIGGASTSALELAYFNVPMIFVGINGSYYEKKYQLPELYAKNIDELGSCIKRLEDNKFKDFYVAQYKNLIHEPQ